MGLRDRAFSANYFIPLFSGVTGAAEAGILSLPVNVNTPYTGRDPDDSVNCGPDVDVDTAVEQPEILYPEMDGMAVTATHTITASDFEASDDQTHESSRWQFEESNEAGDLTGTITFDSGADEENLTSFPMGDAGLSPDTWYLVRVRYKGSDEGENCSPYSEDRLFWVPLEGEVYYIPGGPYGQIYCASFDDATASYAASYIADGHPDETFAPGYPRPTEVSMTDGGDPPTDGEIIDSCGPEDEPPPWLYDDPQVFPTYYNTHGGTPFSGNQYSTRQGAVDELNSFYYGGGSHFTLVELTPGTAINPGNGTHIGTAQVSITYFDGAPSSPGFAVNGKWDAGADYIHTEVVGSAPTEPLVSKNAVP